MFVIDHRHNFGPDQHALSNLPMTAYIMVENTRCTQTMVTQWASFGASALPVPCACLLHPARPLDSLQFVVFSRSLPQPPSVALSPAQSLSVPLSSSVPLSPVWSQTLPPQSAQSTSSTLSPQPLRFSSAESVRLCCFRSFLFPRSLPLAR